MTMTHHVLLALAISMLAQVAVGSLQAAPPPPHVRLDTTNLPVVRNIDPGQLGEQEEANSRNAYADGFDTPASPSLEQTGDREQPNEAPPDVDPTPPSPLHDAGVALIRDFVCRKKAPCLERHGERLARAAHTIVDVCLEDPEVPRYVCLGLVANISNEGGGLEHPSCAGLEQGCVRQCDTIWKTQRRRLCFLRCARAQGVRPRSRAWKAVAKCNDYATSRGPFQMKQARVKQCRKLLGDGFDPFDLAQAARCTMQLVKRSATARYWPCGKRGDRWLVAMKRIGAGVLRKVAEARPGQQVPNLDGGTTWLPPRPAVWEPICRESGYGLRGLRYYRACGESCANTEPITHGLGG